MEGKDGGPGVASLKQCEALGGKDGGIASSCPKDVVERGKCVSIHARAATGMAEVCAGGEPGAGIGADGLGKGEGVSEQANRIGKALVVVCDHTELVEQ